MVVSLTKMDEVISQLRALNQPVPRPMRLPCLEEVQAVEKVTGVSFPPDLKRYLLEGSDVVFGTLEPVTVTNPQAHTHFPTVLAQARELGLPPGLVPICADNADFFCIASSGEVLFWSHNGTSDERWSCLAAWIASVWIGDSL